MRYCASCGAMNDTDAKFCSGCGKKFENASEESVNQADYRTASGTGATGNDYSRGADSNQTYQNTTSNDFSANQNSRQTYGAYSDNNYTNANQYQYSSYNNTRTDGMMESKYHGYSVASMILGICSIIFCYFIPILPLAAAIVGLVLGNKVKRYGDNGMAKAGRITSIIGIVLIAIIIVFTIIGVISLSVAIYNDPNIMNDMTDIYSQLPYYN